VSILTKMGTIKSSDIDLSSQGSPSAAEHPRSSYRMKPVRREDEPPEEACEVDEAPEKDQRFPTEAPDAGAGHFYHDDREFKHGRSRG
jgi:hypothetical protein